MSDWSMLLGGWLILKAISHWKLCITVAVSLLNDLWRCILLIKPYKTCCMLSRNAFLKHIVFPASCTRIYHWYYVAKGSQRGSSHVTWLHPIFKCHFALSAGALMGREGSRTAPGMRTGGRMVVACQTPVVILLISSPAGLNHVKLCAHWFRLPHFRTVYS